MFFNYIRVDWIQFIPEQEHWKLLFLIFISIFNFSGWFWRCTVTRLGKSYERPSELKGCCGWDHKLAWQSKKQGLQAQWSNSKAFCATKRLAPTGGTYSDWWWTCNWLPCWFWPLFLPQLLSIPAHSRCWLWPFLLSSQDGAFKVSTMLCSHDTRATE